MKRLITLIMAVILTLSCMTVVAFGDDSLDDVLNKVEQTEQQVETKTDTTATTENKEPSNDVYDKNKSFIEGLNKAADVSAEVEGVSGVTSGAKTAVAFVVQILAYCITILLALRVVLDLAFIVIPFTRTFLGNGYMGNAQAGAGGIPNSMGIGMNPGMAGGMNPGMAGRMNPGMAGRMNAGQQPNVTGRTQWVSNAALNAVAGENVVGPDGKAVSPFKLYVKDMVVVLVIVPILVTLAVTGALTSLGFVIAQLIVDGLGKIGKSVT